MQSFIIYLHKDVVDILTCFGDLNTVTNKILDMALAGHFPLEHLPTAPDRSGARQYTIIVTNDEYLELCKIRGNNSKNISLRRILYYFVDNELYDTFNWAPKTTYVRQSDVDFTNRLAKLIGDLVKLTKIAPSKHQSTLRGILTLLGGLANG